MKFSTTLTMAAVLISSVLAEPIMLGGMAGIMAPACTRVGGCNAVPATGAERRAVALEAREAVGKSGDEIANAAASGTINHRDLSSIERRFKAPKLPRKIGQTVGLPIPKRDIELEKKALETRKVRLSPYDIVRICKESRRFESRYISYLYTVPERLSNLPGSDDNPTFSHTN